MSKTTLLRHGVRSAIALAVAGGLAFAGSAAAQADTGEEPTAPEVIEFSYEELLADPNISISETEVTKPADVSSTAKVGDVTPLAAYTKTVTSSREWKSLVGITVIRHNAVTTWTYDTSNYLYSSPRSLSSSYWTAPPTFFNSKSDTWDWYSTGSGGNGRANHLASFTTGVPTPWGPIGSTLQDQILVTVHGNGGYSIS